MAPMRASALMAALVVAFTAAPAAAKDTWTTPYPGVKRLHRTTSDPLHIHALVVDLCVPGVSLRATAGGERKRTVSSFGKLVSAEAAVNGDFFSYATYGTSGLAMGNGGKWADTKDTSSSGFVAFGQILAELSLPSAVVDAPPGATEVVSGRPLIVKDGAVPAINCTSHYCELHPRTAVGLSKDRRTLYLVVVDGRTTKSIGVTCKKLGAILVDLGAHVGLNLDGGGSSAMWVAKSGVVNDPSDGNERVVANHLAVQANGLGAGSAPMCVEDPTEEVLHLTAGLDAAESTDFDGDGRADACARAAAGFRCHPSTGAGFGAAANIADLSNAAGFDDPANWATIRMGDVTGDGRADVCARTDLGLRCWPSTGAGFGPPITGPELSDAQGWAKLSHATTLRLGDIDGDGRADLCARAGKGMLCWRSLGDSFAPSVPGPEWSNAAGWDTPERYGTIRMADVDGDGRADLCGLSPTGVECWLSDGAGFPTLVSGPAWKAGWSKLAYWSTLRVADVDGDGLADVCARSAKGLVCHLSQGTSFGPALQSDFMSDASGWWEQSNYLTLRLGDIDGDGDLDACARANKLVVCKKWTATGFSGATIDGPTLSDESGWHPFRFFRSLRLADVDGDGRDDVCARGSAGLSCWKSTGAAFPTKITGPPWSDDSGWGAPQYYGTVRLATARVLPVIAPPDPGEDISPDAGPDAGSDAGASDAPDHGADTAGDAAEPPGPPGDISAPTDDVAGEADSETPTPHDDAAEPGPGWGDPGGGPSWGTPRNGADAWTADAWAADTSTPSEWAPAAPHSSDSGSVSGGCGLVSGASTLWLLAVLLVGRAAVSRARTHTSRTRSTRRPPTARRPSPPR
ncbi:MAG: hypothetical protein AMXMBFR64_04330 [Myxococcales bacterium]